MVVSATLTEPISLRALGVTLQSQVHSARLCVVTRPDEPAAPEAPEQVRVLGPWRVERSLGTNAEGELFEATRDDGQRVAVRVGTALTPDAARARVENDKSLRDRLRVATGLLLTQEAGALEDGRSWLTVEHVANARSFQVSGPTPERIAQLRAAAARLARVHRLGVVHGAIRPGSILVAPDGQVLITDLGQATSTDARVDVKALGALLGQVAAASEDPRAVAALPAIAAAAESDDPAVQPADAAGLVLLLDEALGALGAPSSRAPSAPAPTSRVEPRLLRSSPPPHRSLLDVPTVVGVVLVAGLLVAGLVSRRASPPPAQPDVPAAPAQAIPVAVLTIAPSAPSPPVAELFVLSTPEATRAHSMRVSAFLRPPATGRAWIDGVVAPISSDGSFSRDVPLRADDGPVEISVVALPTGGAAIERQVKLTVDRTPPRIEVLTPSELEEVLDDAQVTLTGEVHDASPTTVLVGSRPLKTAADGRPGVTRFGVRLPPQAAGRHVVTLRVSDQAGNFAEGKRTFYTLATMRLVSNLSEFATGMADPRPGHVYVFRAPGGLTEKWTVLGSEAGVVRYEAAQSRDGEPLGTPELRLWRPCVAIGAHDPWAARTREPLLVGGHRFDCLVSRVTHPTSIETWEVATGDLRVFPGVVRRADSRGVVWELVGASGLAAESQQGPPPPPPLEMVLVSPGGAAPPVTPTAPPPPPAEPPAPAPVPVLRLDQPEEGALQTTRAVLVSGRIVQGEASTVWVLGQPIMVRPDGTFSTSAPLTDGTQRVTVTATADGRGSVSREVTVDTTPPRVRLSSPSSDGMIVKGSSLRVTVIVEDTSPWCDVTVQAGRARRTERANRGAAAVVEVPIPQQDFHLEVRAVDAAGHAAEEVRLRLRWQATTDLSHVRVGARYAFSVPGNMEEVWTILSVQGETVRYRSETIRAGRLLHAPYEGTWSGQYPSAGSDITSARADSLPVEGPGALSCRVIESRDFRRWIAVSGGVATFPGVVKEELNGTAQRTLVRIERP